jgi:hypothetical protein
MTVAAITEKHWQADVIEVATLFGWRTYHTFDSRRSAPGFPDLVLCRPPRFIVAELKTDTGRVGPRQREWLDDLAACAGVEVYVWRPADRYDVDRILARGRLMAPHRVAWRDDPGRSLVAWCTRPGCGWRWDGIGRLAWATAEHERLNDRPGPPAA